MSIGSFQVSLPTASELLMLSACCCIKGSLYHKCDKLPPHPSQDTHTHKTNKQQLLTRRTVLACGGPCAPSHKNTTMVGMGWTALPRTDAWLAAFFVPRVPECLGCTSKCEFLCCKCTDQLRISREALCTCCYNKQECSWFDCSDGNSLFVSPPRLTANWRD